jgi:hypothetical protein
MNATHASTPELGIEHEVRRRRDPFACDLVCRNAVIAASRDVLDHDDWSGIGFVLLLVAHAVAPSVAELENDEGPQMRSRVINS